MKKSFLMIFSRPPYGTSLMPEGLDMALVAGALAQDIRLLFVGDGLWNLAPCQEPHNGRKSIAKQLGALGLYDIEHTYYCPDAAKQRGIDPEALLPTSQPLAATERAKLLASADVVLTF